MSLWSVRGNASRVLSKMSYNYLLVLSYAEGVQLVTVNCIHLSQMIGPGFRSFEGGWIFGR